MEKILLPNSDLAPVVSKKPRPNKKSIDDHVEALRLKTAQIQTERANLAGQAILQNVLPMWDDDMRGAPNSFLRSAIFSAIRETKKSQNRQYLKNAVVHSLSNYTIKQTGETLDQDDLSVWLALLNLAKNQAISDVVVFSGYRLIKDLGWSLNQRSYERVRASILRLKNCSLEITTSNKSQGYAGSLLRDYAFSDMESGDTNWSVRFESNVANLLMADNATLIEWELRKTISSQQPLAMWLLSFYASHRDPIIPYKLVKLQELSGSNATQFGTFKRSVVTSLTKLITEGFLESFEIDAQFFLRVKKSKRFVKSITD